MFNATTGKDDNVASLKSANANLRSDAENAKADLHEVANKAGRKARDMYNTAIDEVSHAKETVTTQIRTNPVQSSMIALGVGFVLGALFRR
jgi:ElaB/YqjD/DUF883 family membrane-anchored ribosome-binding protein